VQLFERYGARLVVLDINLPDVNGFAVCSRLRQNADTPILIVSSRTGKEDKLNGFDLGADDYIEKPFSPSVLVARVKANIAQYLRISKKEKTSPEITIGNIRLNTDAHRVYVDGKEVELKNMEYELLKFLMINVDMVFDRETLYERIWGMEAMGDNATVAVHINRLREKL